MSVRNVALLLAFASLATTGCKSATDSGSNNKLTAAQATWVAEEVASIAVNGLNAGAASGAPLKASGPERIPVNIQLDFTHNCKVSGYAHLLGDVTGNMDEHGTGVLLIGATVSFVACREQTSSGGWIELDGDPDISMAGTFSFINAAPATQQSFSIGGAVRWTWSNGGSNTCPVDISVLFNPTSQGTMPVTISGTACNYSVNATWS